MLSVWILLMCLFMGLQVGLGVYCIFQKHASAASINFGTAAFMLGMLIYNSSLAIASR